MAISKVGIGHTFNPPNTIHNSPLWASYGKCIFIGLPKADSVIYGPKCTDGRAPSLVERLLWEKILGEIFCVLCNCHFIDREDIASTPDGHHGAGWSSPCPILETLSCPDNAQGDITMSNRETHINPSSVSKTYQPFTSTFLGYLNLIFMIWS